MRTATFICLLSLVGSCGTKAPNVATDSHSTDSDESTISTYAHDGPFETIESCADPICMDISGKEQFLCILDSMVQEKAGYVEILVCEAATTERLLYLYNDGNGGVVMVHRTWLDTGLEYVDKIASCQIDKAKAESSIAECSNGQGFCAPCVVWDAPSMVFSSSCQYDVPVEC